MSESKEKIVVFGSGSFGTALAYALSKNKHQLVILTRSPETAASINQSHRNPNYLSQFELPPNIVSTTSAEEALEGATYILHAIPMQQSQDFLKKVAPLIRPDIPIISSSKGIHIDTLQYMSDLVPACLGRDQPMAFFSGPSFAVELMRNVPTLAVVASTDLVLAEKVQKLFSSEDLRVYTTDDVIGVEVGGALKNVFAIAAGICEGLGLGNNTIAALATRGCSEMRKLAVAMGAREKTLAGLTGIGDLMLTCFGNLSRNRTVGKRLGEGEKLEDILATMKEVAEGVPTTGAALKLCNKYKLDLPIIKLMAEVVQGTTEPRDAVKLLMTLPLTMED